MGLLGLLPNIIKTAARVLGLSKVEDVVSALESGNMPPEKRVELQLALQSHEQAMKALSIEELKTVMSETSLMIQSEDLYTKRARPSGLYAAYLISIALVVALIAGVKIDATAILTICGPLYGAQAYYIGQRTREKLNGHG